MLYLTDTTLKCYTGLLHFNTTCDILPTVVKQKPVFLVRCDRCGKQTFKYSNELRKI